MLAELTRRPRSVLTALAPDGVVLPVPDSLGVPAERVLAAPAERATLLDAIVPADRLAVAEAWERTARRGMGMTTVHTVEDPDQQLTLTFLDVRDDHGVLVGVFDPVDPGALDHEVERPAEVVTVSRRPRTATVRKNLTAVATGCDARTTGMLGWTEDELVGRRTTEFLHPDDVDRAVAGWMELLASRDTQRIRLRHRRSDGSWAWLELENRYVAADDSADASVLTEMTDISDEMAAQEALHRSERLLRRLAESVPLGVLQLTTAGGVVFANARLAGLLGVPEVTGLADLEGALPEPSRAVLAAALRSTLEDREAGELELALRLPGSGADRVVAVTLAPLSDEEGTPGALLCLADVTESSRMRGELTERATRDALTGCHNRAATLAALATALEGTAVEGTALTAVVFVDLDDFKPVNDRYGHAAGDAVLRLTAERLAGVLRRGDVVGRMGGDEFLLVAPGLESAAAAAALGRRVREELARPAVLAHGPVSVRASIGVAVAERGTAPEALVHRADEAMYAAKRAGRGGVVLAGTADATR
ncbi:diguanylate cyclase [Geodermatophilus marinus]|nr:diguanylate cyclase [Geodermatophilus sp. LHW52908]